MALLSAHGVSFCYGATAVLADAELTVAAGDAVAVAGRDARRRPNLLVLDEPTNHLDLPAIEQLEQALGRYDGTLLLVTHDRRLLEQVRLTRRLTVADGKLTEE